MSEEQYQYQPELTAIALAYRNKKYIADELFPNVAVGTQSFEYQVIDEALPPRIVNTYVGNKGSANSIEGSIKKLSATCENHAIKELVSLTDIQNYKSTGKNLKTITTESVVEYLKASREYALAQKISDPKNYLGANVKVLGNNEKLCRENSQAVDIIEELKIKVLGGANTMVVSEYVFSKLRRDPSIRKSVNSTTIPDIVSYEAIKELFMLDKILIGTAQINATKKGQTPIIGSLYGNDIALLNINPKATTDSGITFGYSAVYQDIQVFEYDEKDAGLKGGVAIRPSQSYIDLIVGKSCGALLREVIG